MASRDNKLTVDEKRIRFNLNLKSAVELGQYPSSGDGLPTNAFKAITEVAKSYPDIDGNLVQKARQEFAAYVAWRSEIATR